MPAGRSGRPWRRLVARVKREYPSVCHICGEFIDQALPSDHDRAFTVDHVVPLSQGGDAEHIGNLRPAHRLCNLRKGSRKTYTPPDDLKGSAW